MTKKEIKPEYISQTCVYVCVGGIEATPAFFFRTKFYFFLSQKLEIFKQNEHLLPTLGWAEMSFVKIGLIRRIYSARSNCQCRFAAGKPERKEASGLKSGERWSEGEDSSFKIRKGEFRALLCYRDLVGCRASHLFSLCRPVQNGDESPSSFPAQGHFVTCPIFKQGPGQGQSPWILLGCSPPVNPQKGARSPACLVN